jgi:predicted nucleic acid-binding protein
MIAVDTNVLVRFLIADDPDQARRARDLVESTPVWVPLTVMLETEWVLRRLYRLDKAAVTAALRHFAALPGVTVENVSACAQALDWADQGLDFADALHLSAAAACEAFATFDAAFVKRAEALGGPRVTAPAA